MESPCRLLFSSPTLGKMSSRITDELGTPDAAFESTLRPEGFDQFSGQDKVRERLEIAVTAAQQRKEPIDHLLLSGPPGLAISRVDVGFMVSVIPTSMNVGPS